MFTALRQLRSSSPSSPVSVFFNKQCTTVVFVRGYRSQEWFNKNDKDGFLHRSLIKNQGWPQHLIDGRPIIGIANSYSEFVPSSSNLKNLSEWVKRGVWEAGGFPLEFPVTSLGDHISKPTSLMYRNLMAMDVEENIKANPVDGVVLLSGDDKSTPAMLMGASSCDLPTILVSGGPMLNGKFRGHNTGSDSDVFTLNEELKAGSITPEAYTEAETGMSRTVGHRNWYGTASAMECAAESLGISLPGMGSIPAVDSRRNTLAFISGRRIVEMVKDDTKISKLLTRKAFENAIKVNAAMGGNTTFIIHMLALAGRLGVMLDIDDFHRFGKEIPFMVNIRPYGQYLMEDFYYAGGVPAVMKELQDKIVLDQPTVSGKTVAENIANAECFNREVIKTLVEPVRPGPCITILRGNTARLGCVLRTNTGVPHMIKHRGRALVFDSIEEYLGKMDDPDFEVHETNVLVVRNAGPKGHPGMAEITHLPIPKRIRDKGFTDMLRMTDARVNPSVTGSVLMHVSPEAAVGGTISIIRSGDMIDIDLEQQKIHLSVSKEEIQERLKRWRPPLVPEHSRRGYVKMYLDHVNQLDKGADFDFLIGRSGLPPMPQPV